MLTRSVQLREAIQEKKALVLHCQPTELRRCLKCEHWFHSTGSDHRLCNMCKGEPRQRGMAGQRVRR